MMRDCYVTAGWDNRSKLPLWLPRSSQDPGTLEQLIKAWFPTAKDKVTIIFEYIDTDIKTFPVLVPDISPQQQTTKKEISYTSHSTHIISSSSKQFSSSPPLLALESIQPRVKWKGTTHNSVPVNNSDYAKNPSESSSDSSLLSLADLINQVQEIAKTSVDEVDGNSIIIDKPAPLPDHISESSLSSLPSTPSLPQSQFTSFYSSPQISFSSNSLMTTTTSASAPSLTLVQVSRPGYSSLLFVFFAYCL